MATETLVTSDLAIPPGEYLAEVLQELGMNQAELAQRMDRPVQAISEIVSGTKSIVPETALQLERVTGVPAHVWTGLEADYRLILAKQQDEKQIGDQSGLVKEFPYAELARLGYVEVTRVASARVRELCKFFGVVSLRQIAAVADYAPAFRRGTGAASANALAAWLRMATLQAVGTETAPLDRKRLQDIVSQLRELTRIKPEDSLPALKELLAKQGVVLVVQRHLPKTYVHGATFWLSPDKAVIVMTIRGSWADVFWFSFFHELGHLLKHGKREIFLENGDGGRHRADLEAEADTFSCDILIPPTAYAEFLTKVDLSAESIQRFADEIAIAPGIVTGRLQHDKHVPLNFHAHRVRYKWVE
jgi:HTH-type transcriptional regulator/antitoxin HigA